MRSYNVKIKDEKKEKEMIVKAESKEDFIHWLKLFSSFDKREISFEELDKTLEADLEDF